MSSALVDYPSKAREAVQNRATVSLWHTRHGNLPTTDTDMILVWCTPMVLVTSLLFKASSAFTRITTPTSFSGVHP